jgi:hypothetical protein
MARRFTLAEARNLLPQVGRLIADAVTLKAEYQEAQRTLQQKTAQISLMGGMVVNRTASVDAKAQRDRSAEGLKDAIDRIREVGCEVKDVDLGLIDFPTLFHGREVYLCWRLGEPDIEYWHSVEEGFAGRKPIDQDFIDHHEGERTQ